MKKLEAWSIAGVFAALIAVPIAAFASGARPEPNQNRPPTPLPEISVSGILDRELTPQLDAYLQDALIIAPGAVAAEAWTDVAFGDSPSELVSIGSNGWLYFSHSWDRSCLSATEIEMTIENAARAERAVAATGRKLVIGIAPDKAAIVPDFLPEGETCIHDEAASFEAGNRPDWFVTVWDEMRRARANELPIYFRLDAHWTNAGASVLGESIIDALAPGAWDEEAVVRTGTVDREGDLTVLLGLPAIEKTEALETALPGFPTTRTQRTLHTASGAVYEPRVAVDYIGEGDPIIPGSAVVLHDSYGWALTPMIAPYFGTATFISESNPSTGHVNADLLRADTVVYEIVQRSVGDVLIKRDLAARFVSAYVDEFATIETGNRQTGERLELAGPGADTEDLYVIVELLPGTETADAAYNDVTEVLTVDSPRAGFHVGSGGTMFFAGQVEYRIVRVER